MEVKELYRALTEYHGSLAQVARQSGFSREYVRRVLNGDAVNMSIILAAAQVLQELRDRDAQAAAALDKLKD
jgi:AraC-like DNA-binding protein